MSPLACLGRGISWRPPAYSLLSLNCSTVFIFNIYYFTVDLLVYFTLNFHVLLYVFLYVCYAYYCAAVFFRNEGIKYQPASHAPYLVTRPPPHDRCQWQDGTHNNLRNYRGTAAQRQ